jgi:hypothetical protein
VVLYAWAFGLFFYVVRLASRVKKRRSLAATIPDGPLQPKLGWRFALWAGPFALMGIAVMGFVWFSAGGPPLYDFVPADRAEGSALAMFLEETLGRGFIGGQLVGALGLLGLALFLVLAVVEGQAFRPARPLKATEAREPEGKVAEGARASS